MRWATAGSAVEAIRRSPYELSKVIDRCIEHGPEIVTRHGRPAAVVVSASQWKTLTGRKHDFKAFLRGAPLAGVPLERDRDPGCDESL